MNASDLRFTDPWTFDHTSPHYVDDWDERVVIWHSFYDLPLPAEIKSALFEHLEWVDLFGDWITSGNQSDSGWRATVESATGKASALEAITCKALLEWHRGMVPAGRVIMALNACTQFYKAKFYSTVPS